MTSLFRDMIIKIASEVIIDKKQISYKTKTVNIVAKLGEDDKIDVLRHQVGSNPTYLKYEKSDFITFITPLVESDPWNWKISNLEETR